MQKNLGGMLKGIAQLQRKIDAVQKEIAEASFDGEAAAGLVKVTMSGKGEITRVEINPVVMAEDAETLADLVVVAARKAYDAKEAVSKEKLAAIAPGLGSLGLKIPGLG
jgi:DNA-binding YbaB/EbfC family protein